MLDYMKALHDQFDACPPNAYELNEEIQSLSKEVRDAITQPAGHKKLLRLIDLQEERLDNVSLNSFISGFKLAWGIYRDLTKDPSYSFDAAQEERARKSFMTACQKPDEKLKV